MSLITFAAKPIYILKRQSLLEQPSIYRGTCDIFYEKEKPTNAVDAAVTRYAKYQLLSLLRRTPHQLLPYSNKNYQPD